GFLGRLFDTLLRLGPCLGRDLGHGLDCVVGCGDRGGGFGLVLGVRPGSVGRGRTLGSGRGSRLAAFATAPAATAATPPATLAVALLASGAFLRGTSLGRSLLGRVLPLLGGSGLVLGGGRALDADARSRCARLGSGDGIAALDGEIRGAGQR